MTTVIIAEKPSQAKAYAEAFSIKNRTKTYIELEPCSTFKSGAYLTWGIGHLIQLKKPQEYKNPTNTWDLNNLPFIPERFEFEVDPKKKAQFNSVKSLCQKADIIINGCDVDREGSNIFYLILEHAGIKNKTIKRLWINSLEKEEIFKGFNQLKDSSMDYLMYQEAKARMMSDYLIGMNLSPLYTLHIQKAMNISTPFGVGRVQTPTLYMIYKRELEIEQFKPEKFYEIHGDFNKDEHTFTAKMKIKDTDHAKITDVFNEIKDAHTANVSNIEVVEKSQSSPQLHSLSTLQTTANKRWKYSPKKTLQIMQKLYEAKLVTYPRTDTQYITEQEHQYLVNHLDNYLTISDLNASEFTQRDAKKQYVNNSKVQEHYAIILTKQVNKNQIESLSQDEQNIFFEIYNTTLAMFMDDYKYEETKVTLTVAESHDFFATGRVDRSLGWKNIYAKQEKTDEEKQAKLPMLVEGEEISVKPYIHEGMTQAPKPYTEGQLITVMKTCGKYSENPEDAEILKEVEGIGTEATRADVVEKLKQHEYITVSKNKVSITEKGRILCQAVTNTLLSSSDMTAKWEKSLKGITDKKQTLDGFLDNTKRYITHQISNVNKELVENGILDETGKSKIALSNESEYGQCPKCGNHDIKQITTKYGKMYVCEDRDCGFVIYGKVVGKNLSDSLVKELIENKRTKEKVKGFKSKAGKTFDAYLKLDEEYKVVLDFKKEGV